jgi:hypothetical protein
MKVFGYAEACELLKTGQTISYHAGDDGDLELGLDHNYEVKTTGDQSGTTAIIINGKTHNLSNNTVIDHATWINGKQLEWARYVPTADIGPAANGQLFWKQWTLTAESCTFATAGDTITAAAGTPFNTAALCAGRKITITGTVNNDGVVTVTAIANNVITVSENLTDEGPVNTTFATLDDLIWDFLDQANANSLGGYNDWRIPNYRELPSIVDLGHCNPAIDTTVFPSTPSTYHWAASTDPCHSAYAFTVNVYGGVVCYSSKETYKYYVRLVR